MTDFVRPVVEQFDPVSGETIRSDFHVITLLDCLDGLSSETAFVPSSGQDLFLDMTLYDISETVNRALQRLLEGTIDAECWAKVFGLPGELAETVERVEGVNLVMNTVFHSDVQVKATDTWKKSVARYALRLGCDGAFVDYDCADVALDYPDRQYFRYAP